MANNKKLIALVGMTGSGKSKAAEFFKEKGYPVIRFGDAVEQEVKRRGLEVNEVHERMVREELRENGKKMGALALLMEPFIDASLDTHETVVLDGLYSESERRYLLDKYPFLSIVAIWSPPRIRYERLAKRTVRPLTAEQAKSRDMAEIDNMEKAGPIAMADFTVLNTKDEDYLTQQLEQCLQTL
jgi:dephospho-CoA kinase